MDVERDVTNIGRTGQQDGPDHQAGCQQGDAGIEEQPPRREQQQEAQMPPAIADGAKVGRTRAPVLVQGRGHFADIEMGQGGLDHHFGGELHARCAQVE
ncbi:hypothetical protein D3C87_1811780 [compost metagenome]